MNGRTFFGKKEYYANFVVVLHTRPKDDRTAWRMRKEFQAVNGILSNEMKMIVAKICKFPHQLVTHWTVNEMKRNGDRFSISLPLHLGCRVFHSVGIFSILRILSNGSSIAKIIWKPSAAHLNHHMITSVLQYVRNNTMPYARRKYVCEQWLRTESDTVESFHIYWTQFMFKTAIYSLTWKLLKNMYWTVVCPN